MVLALIRAGHTPRQIAKQLDISTQAVYQHLRRLRADGELPEAGR
jgi:DNA-binding CsgD family transcriptional regulator